MLLASDNRNRVSKTLSRNFRALKREIWEQEGIIRDRLE